MKKRYKTGWWIFAIRLFAGVLVLGGCGQENKSAGSPAPVEVTVITARLENVPLHMDFIGQTESSHQVEIRSRIDGFLEKRLYEEGAFVKEGQEMFRMDRRPFEAALQEAKGVLAEQQARLETASANLARIKPLALKNAVSKKDLDDAVGFEKSAVAAVISAQGKVRQAELNLGYTVITSPVSGMSSRAKKQEGSFIASGADSLLTYVAKLDPIWVNFSVSENERLRLIDGMQKGTLIVPKDDNFDMEVVLSDGRVYPQKGRLNFADPSFSQDTGTFLVRGVIANPNPYLLRPGQFVRVKLKGTVRPNVITLPRRAVMQGAKGHFVWVADKNGAAEFRSVTVGEWIDERCIIGAGIKDGDQVVVDGGMKLSPGIPVKAVPLPDRGPSVKDKSAAVKSPDSGTKP